MIIFWAIVFAASLFLLVKGADWLIASSEKIGLAAGLSPFIVGVTIVGLGTSFPELISSFFAVLNGLTDVPVANAIGSNIANILLVVGISAIIGKKLTVTKSLIDLDLPLLAISTVLFLGVVWDKQVALGEAILMLISYGVYLLYTVFHKDDSDDFNGDCDCEVLPSRQERRGHIAIAAHKKDDFIKPRLEPWDFFWLAVGISALSFGAKYLIDSLISLSAALDISAGVIAITAVAIGTSLPELLVSAKAALQRKSEVALGNIFGSNVFNVLIVVGLPGLFGRLSVDEKTFAVGVPAMAMATILFVISGISRRIHIWEGIFYISIYVLFIAKLFDWF